MCLSSGSYPLSHSGPLLCGNGRCLSGGKVLPPEREIYFVIAMPKDRMEPELVESMRAHIQASPLMLVADRKALHLVKAASLRKVLRIFPRTQR
jgi:hypothetical protein